MVDALSFLSPGWREQGGVLFQPWLPNMRCEHRKSLDLKVHVARFNHSGGDHSFGIDFYREDDTGCEFVLSSQSAKDLLSTSNSGADFYGRMEVAAGQFEFVHLTQPEHNSMLKILQTWH